MPWIIGVFLSLIIVTSSIANGQNCSGILTASGSEDFRVEYAVNSSIVTFRVVANQGGWAGIGFSTSNSTPFMVN